MDDHDTAGLTGNLTHWPDERVGPMRGKGLGDDLGAGLVEYGLLILIVAIACIGSLIVLAPIISAFYNQLTALL